MATKSDINLFDPDLQQCPYDAYKRLRDEAPVFNIPGTPMYVVSRYDDVREVLMDPARFPARLPKRSSAHPMAMSSVRAR